MAKQTWVLTDLDQGIFLDELTLEGDQLGRAARDCRVNKKRLQGGTSDGVDVVTVDNGACSIVVVPTRGMGIQRAQVSDLTLGWQSPVKGPVHPQYVPLMEPGGLGWLFGFDELLVRCGLENNGAPEFSDQGALTYPLHGRIANRAAHYVSVSVDSDTGEIEVHGIVDEVRFHFLKLRLHATLKTRPGERGFRISDRIENLSDSPAEAQILYHVNYGVPLLDAGAKLVAPIQQVVPRDAVAAKTMDRWSDYQGEQPGFDEVVYFFELAADQTGDTQIVLKNAHGLRGVRMAFNTKQLPCFTVWKNTTGKSDGYVTGLEPGSNFPNPRSFEGKHGRVIDLAPHGSQSFDLTIEGLVTAEQVQEAERQVGHLQKVVEPQIAKEPREDWCGEPPPL
ncbi:MAG: aldose 1-epimerase family protein [Pirellulaceae bacterium]|nr:aldose 1-epimerase family protein [Pirellulaceae bacterium]